MRGDIIPLRGGTPKQGSLEITATEANQRGNSPWKQLLVPRKDLLPVQMRTLSLTMEHTGIEKEDPVKYHRF